jgi:hypothetical protein
MRQQRFTCARLSHPHMTCSLPRLFDNVRHCLVFLKLFERIYAPLTAGLLSPIKADAKLEPQRRSQLDRLYQRVIDDLDTLVQAVGLKAA